jgi:hypothetical protein
MSFPYLYDLPNTPLQEWRASFTTYTVAMFTLSTLRQIIQILLQQKGSKRRRTSVIHAPRDFFIHRETVVIFIEIIQSLGVTGR